MSRIYNLIMDEKKLLKNFGFNFKVARMKMGLTQDNIVEMTDLSNSYLSNIENGKNNPSLTYAVKLSQIVNKTIEELISDI